MYIGVEDIRAAGLEPEDYPDAIVERAIKTWQAVLERACGQWFEPRKLRMRLDGNDSDTLHFSVPIIEVEWLKINGDTTPLDPSRYVVYNGRGYPDDRRNPRIKLTSRGVGDIYTASHGRPRFLRGYRNQEVSGTFGYTEEDGSTPEPIRYALTKLVREKLTTSALTKPKDAEAPVTIAGIVIEEETDGHRIRYQREEPSFKSRRAWLTGITMDQEILDIFRMYRAPIALGAPADWSYESRHGSSYQ